MQTEFDQVNRGFDLVDRVDRLIKNAIAVVETKLADSDKKLNLNGKHL